MVCIEMWSDRIDKSQFIISVRGGGGENGIHDGHIIVSEWQGGAVGVGLCLHLDLYQMVFQNVNEVSSHMWQGKI